jgi:hypothetical protein
MFYMSAQAPRPHEGRLPRSTQAFRFRTNRLADQPVFCTASERWLRQAAPRPQHCGGSNKLGIVEASIFTQSEISINTATHRREDFTDAPSNLIRVIRTLSCRDPFAARTMQYHRNMR